MPVGVAPPLDDAARERRSGFAAAIESDASMAIKSASAKESAVNLMAKYDRNRDGTFASLRWLTSSRTFRSKPLPR